MSGTESGRKESDDVKERKGEAAIVIYAEVSEQLR